jgi:transmembrane sensor
MDEQNPSARIKLLAKKWQDGTITAFEKEEFDEWYADFENVLEINTDESYEKAEQRLYSLIAGRAHIGSKRKSGWFRIAAAASVLLCLSIGGYYYITEQRQQQIARLQINDVAPGGNKAILTLANGQQIVLTSAKNGQLALQGNTEITKTADGDIAYHQAKDQSAALSASSYNTVSTPVGGQYHLTLADGTSVWLNAASSIRYPTAFTGAERKVEITGEAYFEVTHNAAKPFRVQSAQQVVEVLGTHFNVNTYADENKTKTTLLEGSVKVTGSNSSKLIKPGQQAVLSGSNLTVAEADVEEAVAWKNGYFKFNENLETIMGKIARWYDVRIVYQSRPDPGYLFEGEISRARHLSEILKIMEYTGKVHFTVEGRRIIVNK